MIRVDYACSVDGWEGGGCKIPLRSLKRDIHSQDIVSRLRFSHDVTSNQRYPNVLAVEVHVSLRRESGLFQIVSRDIYDSLSPRE